MTGPWRAGGCYLLYSLPAMPPACWDEYMVFLGEGAAMRCDDASLARALGKQTSWMDVQVSAIEQASRGIWVCGWVRKRASGARRAVLVLFLGTGVGVGVGVGVDGVLHPHWWWRSAEGWEEGSAGPSWLRG